MKTVAFLGLGNMGQPMTRNLVQAGFQVIGFDPSSAALDTAERHGVQRAASAPEAASSADVVITMLPTGDNVRDAYLGASGVIAASRKGALLMDSSTISSTVTVEIAAAARAAGRRMIDAPVSGGTPRAHSGTLTFMVGGEVTDVEHARPLLEAMGQRIYHVGASGAGHTAKLCNNILSGICMAGTVEALALGVANGLDPAILSDVMRNSSGNNYALERYHPFPGLMENVPSANGFAGGFRSDFQLKDMRLAKELANSSKVLAAMGNLATELFAIHCQNGHAGEDYSSIIKLALDLDSYFEGRTTEGATK
ncbi:3-hydroxyisobutyrate dehydrogenase [Mesorhizobium sp. CO1-1-4]|uniref:3-hydroxyisobutyrate dehydrogenase n=1 Tax=Mesorhizobium sp. CO1-1-4 TaxID=2876633 RepID=UPI001CCF724C|nr:3-hydroxyisobutyrate dehydrogenase [Mesorhizobium sp. CO1-1-4]MBZ9738739.1 3-hydroxyisobutyrate dehydrogenase [Mesorhizobium sp. CO1-1-4]